MRVGKFALMVPVMTSTDGPLRRQDHVQAGGARHLREALHRAFDVLAGDHHQVGHLVDDDDDERQRLEVELLLLVDRLAALLVVAGMDGAGELLALRLRFGEARVVAVDVAHAELRHLLVALLHLAHRPLQRDHRLLRVGDDRREQMRDAVVDGELEHLRIDHDQPALVGLQPVEQAQDHGVDGDRLAGAGGAGDQQMRHAREIDDHRLAADGLAEAERQLGGRCRRSRRWRAARADRPSRASGSAARCRWRCARPPRRRGPRARSSSARCRRRARSRATT